MSTSYIQPQTGGNQRHDVRSAVSKSLQVLFVVTVTLGTLAGTGLVLWLLSVLATSKYGIYFGA